MTFCVNMKKDQLVAWTRDLRSGAFKQTYAVFKNSETNEFCCLGVLCVSTGEPQLIDDRGNWNHVVELLGSVHHELYKMNDAGMSFTNIAAWIDTNLEPSDAQT